MFLNETLPLPILEIMVPKIKFKKKKKTGERVEIDELMEGSAEGIVVATMYVLNPTMNNFVTNKNGKKKGGKLLKIRYFT